MKTDGTGFNSACSGKFRTTISPDAEHTADVFAHINSLFEQTG